MFEKLDPNIIDSMERGILATILFDNNTIKQIKENIFTNHQYKEIFEIMVELYKNNFPISEDTVMAKLDSSYESALLNIMITNPISHIESIYASLLENNYNTFLQNQLRKIAFDENSSIEKIKELEALIQRSKNFKRQEIFDIIDFETIEAKTPSFLLEDFIPLQENEINIISAPGGSGKSYITLLIALMFVHKYTLKKCFLWLSEDEIGVSKKRALSLCKIYKELKINKNITVIGKETQVFHFVDKNLKVNDKFELMKKQLKDYSLIVLDPLIAYFGADENSNADARYFMSLLNKWCVDDNKTIILIHHHTKATGTNKSNARGASAFIDACRMHYIVEKIENDSRCRKLVIDKTNHFSSEKKDYTVRLFDTKVDITTFKQKEERKNTQKYSIPILGNLDETEVDEL